MPGRRRREIDRFQQLRHIAGKSRFRLHGGDPVNDGCEQLCAAVAENGALFLTGGIAVQPELFAEREAGNRGQPVECIGQFRIVQRTETAGGKEGAGLLLPVAADGFPGKRLGLRFRHVKEEPVGTVRRDAVPGRNGGRRNHQRCPKQIVIQKIDPVRIGLSGEGAARRVGFAESLILQRFQQFLPVRRDIFLKRNAPHLTAAQLGRKTGLKQSAVQFDQRLFDHRDMVIEVIGNLVQHALFGRQPQGSDQPPDGQPHRGVPVSSGIGNDHQSGAVVPVHRGDAQLPRTETAAGGMKRQIQPESEARRGSRGSGSRSFPGLRYP